MSWMKTPSREDRFAEAVAAELQNGTYRGPIWDEAGEKQIFLPGRGVGTHNNNARNLLFRKVTDDELGKGVWVYLLSDHADGWKLRPILRTGVTVNYTIRWYASEAATLTVTGGAGTSDTHNAVAEGWQTDTGALDGAADFLADSHGLFIKLSGANISVAKATVTQ